jgi:hypothetical protein
MAQEIIGFKIEINGQEKVVGSIGEMKKLLKEANFELLAAQQNFGEYSQEALNAAKNVANLKDSIQEAAETSQLFDPGKKFQAFAGALSAVAGGFTAVQGALGLVGVESDNVQKSLLKVQSALALSQGLSTVADSVKDFQRLAAVIQNAAIFQKAYNVATVAAAAIQRAFGVAVTTTSVAFKALRAAIISTGIGALVVGVGLLVEQIIKWVNSASAAEKAQEKLAASTKKMNGEIDNQIAVLTALGGKEEEIYQLRLKRNDNELNVLRNKLKTQGKLSEEELEQFRKLKTDKEVLDIQEQNRIKKNQEDEAKRIKDENDKASKSAEEQAQKRKKLQEDEAKAELERIERQRDARRALFQNLDNKEEREEEEKRKKKEEAFVKDQQRQLERTLKAAEQARTALRTLTDKNLEDTRNQYIAQLNAEGAISNESYNDQIKRYQLTRELQRQSLVDRKASAAEFAAFDAETKKGEEDRERAATETKLGIISGALGAIGDAVGRNTVAGKALSIAQATIDTYAGANKALATYPPPFGAIAAGTVVLGGLLNIKKIVSTKVPPAPGSKGIRDTTAAPSIQAPIAPPAPLVNTRTQLDSQSIQQLGSASARTYVLESDVTNSQERIRRINRAARLS